MRAAVYLTALAAPALAAKSSGCGTSTSLKAGTTTKMTGKYGGVTRTWYVYLPKSYSSSRAYPLIVSTHGWGGDGPEDEDDSGLSVTSGNLGADGFIAVYPDGRDDNTSRGGPWGSWNCVGSTIGTSSKGATCQNWADAQGSYCYSSCGKCANKCMWTSCANDISTNGYGKVDSSAFVPQLYDLAEQSFCVDTAREYHTGMSNGAMFTFQAGVSMSSRLAAIAPIAGSFHYGFLQAPTSKVPLLAITGTRDTSVPANSTSSSAKYAADSSGYYWEKFSEIAKGWKVANGCSASTAVKHYTPQGVSSSLVSQYKLECVDQGCDVYSCAWSGAHLYFGGAGRYWGGGQDNGDLVWAFFDQYSKASHIGGGRVAGEVYDTPMPAHQIADVQVFGNWTRPVPEPFDAVHMAPEERPAPEAKVHYRNPLKGACLKDETMLELSNGAETGFVCAPRKVKSEANGAGAPCAVGGIGPVNNGCPGDRPAPANGTKVAYPTCLSYPVPDQDFHCLLTCDPCSINDHECSQEAHDMCPEGAKCMTGFMSNVRQGLCVFTDFDPSDDGQM